MSKFFYFILFVSFVSLLNAYDIHAQNAVLKVRNFKGEIKYEQKILRQDDQIKVRDLKTLRKQIVFSSASDWIAFRNVATSKLLSFFAEITQKETSGYFATKGGESILLNLGELKRHFDHPTEWFWTDDTIQYLGKDPYPLDSLHILLLAYQYQGQKYYSPISRGQKIIITHENLFRRQSAELVDTVVSSFETDSLSLVFMDLKLNKSMRLSMRPLHWFFIDDYIEMLKISGFTEAEISSELMDVVPSSRNGSELTSENMQALIKKAVAKFFR